MNIAKPWTVTVIEDCHGLDHSKCAGKQEKPDITLICSCRCHNNEKEQHMSETAFTPISVRARWSQQEIDYLTANASKGAAALAAALNRTPTQVRSKAMSLGVSLRMEGSLRGRRKASV